MSNAFTRDAFRARWILGGAALFAMAWAIARASVQSITVDEATTYNIFVYNRRYLWYAANNHILNSTLMYGFTRLLGLSQLTARLPALIGAAFYITAAYRLCRLLGASLLVQLTLFVCLVFNPFIFDYLVAARGYGLALGFLMWAIVYSAEAHIEQTSLLAACAVSSLCAGLSVDANFSFAFVNLAAMTAILVCAWRQRPNEWPRLLAAGVLPGAAVFTIVSGYALSHTHPGELIYGATNLGETFGTVIEASLFQSPLDFLSPIVFPLVGSTGLLWLLYVVFRRAKTPVAPLGWAAAAIFVTTVAVHWTAFRLFGLLLPKDRTAIFFFPLFMIAAGVLATIPSSTRPGRRLRACFLGSLALMAAYFLLCLRLNYFKEWYWDSDVPQTYAVLSCLNRTNEVTHVASTWSYRGPLNFYQIAQPTSMEDITDMFDPQRTQVYVVDMLHSSEALEGKDLKIFYRSPTTDLVLAAEPQVAETLASGPCLGTTK
jgi:hypothetical protein